MQALNCCVGIFIIICQAIIIVAINKTSDGLLLLSNTSKYSSMSFIINNNHQQTTSIRNKQNKNIIFIKKSIKPRQVQQPKSNSSTYSSTTRQDPNVDTQNSTNTQTATQLYENLMMNYNKHVRPVTSYSDVLVVKLGVRLAQIIEVNMRYQMMTSMVWVEQEWTDSKLKWDPDEYGGVTKLHVPAEDIWRPDIVLYNNADGEYVVTTMNKATVYFDGRVLWDPPAIYKTACNIDVSYFPFDEQTCIMKFGTWSFNGNQIELRHKNQPDTNTTSGSSTHIENGMDLTDFLLNVEWDLMSVPAIRHEVAYDCCVGGFYDVIFYLTLRRKTLFYTVNLIVPCIVMSLLSILVFYLPSDSNEKVSLTISIVISVDVFLLCLVEIMPPTSFVVPLLGIYLLFTLCLITISVFCTVYVLNINFRQPSTHKMSSFYRRVFLELLPPLLFMKKRYKQSANEMSKTKFVHCNCNHSIKSITCPTKQQTTHSNLCKSSTSANQCSKDTKLAYITHSRSSKTTTVKLCGMHQEIQNAFLSLDFVAKRMQNKQNFSSNNEDWMYMATVIDRLLLFIFSSVLIIGTAVIILQAPLLYDTREPIDQKLSVFGPKIRHNHLSSH